MHRVSDSVVQQCDHAARLTDLVSGVGPVKVTVADTTKVIIERAGEGVEIIEDADVARFFVEAPGRLRTLAEAVATIYTKHTPERSGDLCPECGRQDPCTTRRLLNVRILRADDAEAGPGTRGTP